MWDVVKAGLRRKFIALNANIKKEQRTRINNLSFYFRQLEKESKSKISRRKIKISVETNEIENKPINKINKTKSWLFEEISKIYKPLARP